jgi:hypothetical protein
LSNAVGLYVVLLEVLLFMPNSLNIFWFSSIRRLKLEYQIRRVRSCFNYVIELNQKMLILKRFVSKGFFMWWWQLNCL